MNLNNIQRDYLFLPKNIILLIVYFTIFIIAQISLGTKPINCTELKSKLQYRSSSAFDIDSFYINIDGIGKLNTWSGYEYPKGSDVHYIGGTFPYFGGILKGDTLVTESSRWELYRQIDKFTYRSISHPSEKYRLNAVSDQDVILYSTDNDKNFISNALPDQLSGKNYKPLNIEIIDHQYSWSYEYIEDVVFHDYWITNIGEETIYQFYFMMESHITGAFTGGSDAPQQDNISGFLQSVKIPNKCKVILDTLNLLWVADNDGDPIEGEFTRVIRPEDGIFTKSAPDVTGFFFLNYSDDYFQKLNYSFNWVVNTGLPFQLPDWGPRRRKNFRNFRTGSLGNPVGNLNLYHMMSGGEIDYDQILTASIKANDSVWMYPDQEYAVDYTDGWGMSHNYLSIGPFKLPPGTTVKIPMAYVAGENFHTKVDNIDYLPHFPQWYYHNLDFSDLANNAQWARWIYDNPGIDTDGDGYAGEFKVCVYDSVDTDSGWVATVADTFFYRGDGIPDWRAAGPPPPPRVNLIPGLNSLTIRFNGTLSETEEDIFTKIPDFEGYNVYFGRDDRESSLSLAASYDKHNYDKYIYYSEIDNGIYRVQDIPYSLDELMNLYKIDDPLIYSRTSPYFHPDYPDSIFYFRKHSFNTADLGNQTPITKVYPDARDPRLFTADQLTQDDYTSDSLFKYFEYEVTIDNLLSTVQYWANVTAFDFGAPKSGLKALESSKTINIKSSFIKDGYSGGTNDKVYVYPNPYRIDADYRGQGFEGRTEDDRPNHRVRSIWFANLPPKCTISIFSLDGDLVKQLDHDFEITDPNYTNHRWDLITRNTQMTVSGLYYWTVESSDGTVQIGKLVILM